MCSSCLHGWDALKYVKETEEQHSCYSVDHVRLPYFGLFYYNLHTVGSVYENGSISVDIGPETGCSLSHITLNGDTTKNIKAASLKKNKKTIWK